jgi:hypothetical protein
MQRWDEAVVSSLVLRVSYSHPLDAAIHGYFTQLKHFRTSRAQPFARGRQSLSSIEFDGGAKSKTKITIKI